MRWILPLFAVLSFNPWLAHARINGRILDQKTCDEKTKNFDDAVGKAEEGKADLRANGVADWKVDHLMEEAKKKLAKSFFTGLLNHKKFQDGLDLLGCEKFQSVFSTDELEYFQEKFRNGSLLSSTSSKGKPESELQILNLQAQILDLQTELSSVKDQISKINQRLNMEN